MSKNYKRIVLASRPRGWCNEDNFKLEEVPIPQLKDGEVLVRNHFMSLDPYMRGRMNDAKSYAAPQSLNETMQGGTVGVVATSRHPGFVEGDSVVSFGGWQEYSIVDPSVPGALV